MKKLVLEIISELMNVTRKSVKCLAILLLLVVFLSSCKDDKMDEQQISCENYPDVETPCIMGECIRELDCYYLQVWKEMFLEETGFTEEYFSKHVFICYGGVCSVSSIPGTNYRKENFEIKYQVQVGWALISHTEIIIVKHEDDPYLTKEDIQRERIPYNYHEELSNPDILKFASLNSAMAYLKEQTLVDNLFVSFVYFAPNTGNFILEAIRCDETRLGCYPYFDASLNLITGEITTYEGYVCAD